MPNNPYGYAKDALRRQLEFLKFEYEFECTWARLFYMYGDGQHRTALYSQLKQAVLRGDRTFNLSGGEQLRDYLPVRDVAWYLVAVALQRINAGVVNVCSGQPVSIRKLVESWLKTHGWEIEPNFGYYAYPDYEPMAFWGDRRRLDTLLESS
jgi:dTDP-6-deoxy-L-talose 4-dehydrogenase (NAD+)